MLSSASSRMLSFAKLTLGGHVASSVGSRFFQQRGFFSAVPCVASSSTHGSCSTGALVRAFSSSGAGGVLVPASLPDLPYDYSALEPAISADIMKLHHSKHHQTYVTNFNATMEKVLDAQAKGDTAAAIALQGAVKFNGGGHVNHSIFWQNLCPVKDFTPPEGALLSAINDEFGSLDAFQTKFAATAAGVQGSGWGWLGYDKATGRLAITTTANQDPCVTTGLVPLLGVDVWEHAYYLQYKNVRPDYLKAVWDVVNWKDVATKLEHAKA